MFESVLAMTTVTEYLTQLIAKQVDDKGLVVWYDPEQAYLELVREWLALPTAYGCVRRQLPQVAEGN